LGLHLQKPNFATEPSDLHRQLDHRVKPRLTVDPDGFDLEGTLVGSEGPHPDGLTGRGVPEDRLNELSDLLAVDWEVRHHSTSALFRAAASVPVLFAVGFGRLVETEDPSGFDQRIELGGIHTPPASFIANANAQGGAPARDRVRGA